MDVRILGPLELSVRGPVARRLPLGGAKQRGLLALLAVHANTVVSKDRLVEELWAGEPFDAAVNTLQVTVSRLRKVLHADSAGERLVTRAPGYLLAVGPDELDAAVFERLLADGRSAMAVGAPERAAERLRRALALFRGRPLADFAYEPFAQHEIARLEDLRLVALEQRIAAELTLGSDGSLTAELEALVGAHPARERFRAQLMLSLYRSGRQAEALATFERTRQLMLDELGLEPGPQLQRLQQAILRQEPQLELPAEREPAVVVRAVRPGTQQRVRKSVTALSGLIAEASVGGGHDPDLDPEALELIRAGGFDAAARILARHGAAVEPAVGDTVIATFGHPESREDDALRALRAAVDLGAAIADLNAGMGRDRGIELTVRSGVHTGEVVAGGDVPLTGGPVAAATRLAHAVGGGEVAIGEATRRLLAHAVRVEPHGDGAWRLVEVLPGAAAISRSLDSPLVGRAEELSQLRRALDQAVATRSPQVVTVLGEAGIGKTRLVQALSTSVADRADVLVGRCLSYGEEITFSPLREIVGQAAGGETVAHIRALLEGEADGAGVAAQVATAIGTGDTRAALADTLWAFRRMFECLARRRPLVVVLDDVHWAEPALLELVGNVAEHAADAPMLLVCVARPELADARSGWSGARITLEPLAEGEIDQLIDNVIGAAGLAPDARSRIVGTAEGNPLFVEQMLAFLADDTAGQQEVLLPPTIQALLAARLEHLGPGERAVVEPAAVIGREYWQGAVVDLVAAEAKGTAGRNLRALVRKQLAVPAPSTLPGEEAFRFVHVLIQEATYRSISKQRRAELHQRFAQWLEQKQSGGTGEHEETLGFHLERAYRYLAELGPVDAAARDLAARAARLLAVAGRRASARSDAGAAKRLLSRAAALLEDTDPLRLELLLPMAEACLECGDFEEADGLLEVVIAAEQTRPALAAQATLVRLKGRMFTRPDLPVAQIATDLQRPMAVFASHGDDAGLASALALLASVHGFCGRAAAAAQALEETIVHARRAGDKKREADARYWLCIALLWGPTPAEEVVARCEALAEDQPGLKLLEAGVLYARAGLAAMQGQADEARVHCERGVAIVQGLGRKALSAAMEAHLGAALIERLAGDPAAAEAKLRRGLEELEQLGETAFRSTTAAFLAGALFVQGRYEEAEALTVVCEETAARDDVDAHVHWRRVRAKLLARRGEHGEAERLAREAVVLASGTDQLNNHGDALVDLGEVLVRGGRPADARPHLEEALQLYERKGNLVQAGWTSNRLGRLPS